MSFDWNDYITLARKLLYETNKGPIEEAYNRSVISRSYYAVFCISRVKAELESYRPRNPGDRGVHEKVISYYKNSSKKEEKRIGKLLDVLRRERNKADYEKYESIDTNLAEGAILIADEVLALFEKVKIQRENT